MKPLMLLGSASVLLALLRLGVGQTTPPRPNAAVAPAPAAFRITFGELQERETDYSGSLSLSEGAVAELVPWRFFGSDALNGQNAWTLHTVRAQMENQPDEPRPISTPGPNQTIVPKGITAVVNAPGTANVSLETHRGTYRFRLSELAGGHTLRFEDGDVTV